MTKKVRSRSALVREYQRAKRALATRAFGRDADEAEMQGALQALAWALQDDAMAPVKLFSC